MNFGEFVVARRSGALDRDAGWRAYMIEAAVRSTHVRGALKLLRMGYAGELAIPQVAAMHGLSVAEAKLLLGAWWVWSRVAEGRPVRGLRKRSGATPLAVGAGSPP